MIITQNKKIRTILHTKRKIEIIYYYIPRYLDQRKAKQVKKTK